MLFNSVLRFGMKVILTAAAIVIVSSGSSYSNPFNSPAPNYMGLPSAEDSIVFQNDSVFTIEGVKEELSKDGEWIKVTQAEVDPEGVTDGGGFDDEINTEYVWRPYNMDPDWTPYSNGHWRYTNCGWMWVSHYHWGWRPYHYGRWWWSNYYGWVWSPGFIFAPAWVVWIYNDGYCGWYPISPRVRWHHHYGYRCHKMRYRTRHWTFCEKRRFADPLITPGVIVDPMHNPAIISNGTYNGNVIVENNQVKNEGPNVNDIEKNTGTKQPPENVNRYNNPDKVKEILNTGDNGQKEKYTEDRKKVDEKINTGRKNENDVSRDSEKKRNEDVNREKKQPEKRTDDKRSDGKKKDTYSPPNNERKDNGKKDTYTPPTKKEEKKESYKQPPKNDNGRKKDTYTPPKDNNDGGRKDDNSKKSDDNNKNNGKK